MKHITYLHLIEKEAVKDLEAGILEVIDSISIDIFHGSSKILRKQIADGLKKKGWSSKIKLSIHSNITITATNGKTALCLQTGNMGRFYADLLKLQFLYQSKKIVAAIYILPTNNLAKKMGSNLANYERLVTELKIFQEVITTPIAVIGVHQ
jgi:hypothetical protein